MHQNHTVPLFFCIKTFSTSAYPVTCIFKAQADLTKKKKKKFHTSTNVTFLIIPTRKIEEIHFTLP